MVVLPMYLKRECFQFIVGMVRTKMSSEEKGESNKASCKKWRRKTIATKGRVFLDAEAERSRMNRAKKKAEKEGRPWIPEEYEQAMDNMEQEVMEGATGGKVDGGYRQPMVIGKFPARHMQLRSDMNAEQANEDGDSTDSDIEMDCVRPSTSGAQECTCKCQRVTDKETQTPIVDKVDFSCQAYVTSDSKGVQSETIEKMDCSTQNGFKLDVGVQCNPIDTQDAMIQVVSKCDFALQTEAIEMQDGSILYPLKIDIGLQSDDIASSDVVSQYPEKSVIGVQTDSIESSDMCSQKPEKCTIGLQTDSISTAHQHSQDPEKTEVGVQSDYIIKVEPFSEKDFPVSCYF